MNSSHANTMLRDHGSAHRDTVPGRAARLLARGPATMKSPAARWTVNVLAIAGAALMVWSSVIHLQLWSDGYRSISVIGPLFLIQGVGGIALAVVLAVFRRLILMAAGAVTMAATAAGLLLSAGIGLFGFTESLAVPYAGSSLVVEFAGAAVLAAASAIVLAARPGPGGTALAALRDRPVQHSASARDRPVQPATPPWTGLSVITAEFPQFMPRGPIFFRPSPVCSVCG